MSPAAKNPFDLLDVDDTDDMSMLMSHHMKLAEKKAAEDKATAEAVKAEKVFERKVKDSISKRAEAAKLRIKAKNYERDCDRLIEEVEKLKLVVGSEEYERRLVSYNEKNDAARKARVQANRLDREAGTLEEDVRYEDNQEKLESLANFYHDAAAKSMRDEANKLKNEERKLIKEMEKLHREIEGLAKGSEKRKQKELSMDEKDRCAFANRNLANMLYREAENMESGDPKLLMKTAVAKPNAVGAAPFIPERPSSSSSTEREEEDKTMTYAEYLKKNAKKSGKEETKKVVKKDEKEEVTKKGNKVNGIKELAKIKVKLVYPAPPRPQYKKPEVALTTTGAVAPAVKKNVEVEAPAVQAPQWSKKLFGGESVSAPVKTAAAPAPASEKKVVKEVNFSVEKDFPSLR